MGMSDTTYLFLKEASKKREFQVGAQWGGALARRRCVGYVQGEGQARRRACGMGKQAVGRVRVAVCRGGRP